MKPDANYKGKANVSFTLQDCSSKHLVFNRNSTKDIYISYNKEREMLFELSEATEENHIINVNVLRCYYYDNTRDIFIARSYEYLFFALRINSLYLEDTRNNKQNL
jgi:hypothetical protein